MFKNVIGHKLVSIHMDDDHLSLGLEIGCIRDIYAVITLNEECCSYSYFHDISGVDQVLGKIIVSITSTGRVSDIDISPNEHDNHDDSVEQYGLRFSAEPEEIEIAGNKIEISRSMIVEFRNSSNGYYGGGIGAVIMTDEPKGKLVAQL